MPEGLAELHGIPDLLDMLGKAMHPPVPQAPPDALVRARSNRRIELGREESSADEPDEIFSLGIRFTSAIVGESVPDQKTTRPQHAGLDADLHPYRCDDSPNGDGLGVLPSHTAMFTTFGQMPG